MKENKSKTFSIPRFIVCIIIMIMLLCFFYYSFVDISETLNGKNLVFKTGYFTQYVAILLVFGRILLNLDPTINNNKDKKK